MLEARLFTNVGAAWISRRADDRPLHIEIDALWVEAEYVVYQPYEVVGLVARNGRVDTSRAVFHLPLDCDPLEHEFQLSEPPKPQLARADLVFKDGTRIGLRVRDRQRPVDVLDATKDGAIYRNKLWEMMSAKVREYSVEMN